MLHPEVAGRERGLNIGDNVILQHLPGAQAGHCDVLLPEVGIHGSFALDGRTQILHSVSRSSHGASIGLQHAHVRNLHPLIGGAVANNQLSPLLERGLALHLDASVKLALAGAVVFEAVSSAKLLDDIAFL